ncbi:MAG: NAD-dependent succinate-semialdehyde dehydrogenase [Actinobacteria bacterium]|nr:NAD-dependent succinate-semialdehyde dehydrogenase [Actinomycetota bacterium]
MNSPASALTDAGLWRQDLLIDGAWTAAADDRRIAVTDPASGAVVANVADGDGDDARRAIDAAAGALAEWSGRTALERARVLRAWFDLIVAAADDLARILVAEQGKPLAEARGEVLYGAGFVEWFAEEAKRAYGDLVPTNVAGRRILVLKQPIGVCAAITPWNFPSAMILRKAAPALAAGCTMVLKPATETPLSALALGELAIRAGLPPGVLNIVHGPPAEIGGELTTDPRVRKLTFTGSTEVGRLLMRQSAGTVKRLSLELGGNAPLIVFDDADLDEAVAGAMAAKFRNSGQTCVCPNRILAQDGIHDAFVERLVAATVALRVGEGLEPGVEQGPLIDERAVAKVEAHIDDAVRRGAAVATGGARHARGGTYFEPTVLTGVEAGAILCGEETFGPLAPVLRFGTEAEAIELANATEFGLSAYLFSHDLGRVFRVAEALEFGVVAVNTGAFSYEGAPFGGVKQSGLGREGSRHGLDDFLEIKYLCLEGISAPGGP